MGIKELAAQVHAARPGVPLPDVTAVLNQALKLLREELRTTTDKVVRLGPLGQVRITDKTAEKAGAEPEAAPAVPVRRLMLKLANAKAEAGQAGEGAAKKGKGKLKAGKAAGAKKAKAGGKPGKKKAGAGGAAPEDKSQEG